MRIFPGSSASSGHPVLGFLCAYLCDLCASAGNSHSRLATASSAKGGFSRTILSVVSLLSLSATLAFAQQPQQRDLKVERLDTILKSRGDCVDPTAGPKLVPRGEPLPQNLDAPGIGREQRDLLFLRQKNTAVISSPVPLNGPVIYEFRLAHR